MGPFRTGGTLGVGSGGRSRTLSFDEGPRSGFLPPPRSTTPWPGRPRSCLPSHEVSHTHSEPDVPCVDGWTQDDHVHEHLSPSGVSSPSRFPETFGDPTVLGRTGHAGPSMALSG